MARRHNKEGRNHLEQESNRQRTMEGTDGGLHPAVDGQCLGERCERRFNSQAVYQSKHTGIKLHAIGGHGAQDMCTDQSSTL